MSNSMPLRVAVLFGGCGAEHAVSCASAASVLTDGCDGTWSPIPVYIARDGAWYLFRGAPAALAEGAWQPKEGELVPTFPVRLGDGRGLLTEGHLMPVDVALPVLHGDGGEDGVVQGLLSAVGLPFVGADTRTGALCTDKAVTKTLAAACGIPVTPSVTVRRTASFGDALRALTQVFGDTPPPLFVKPTSLGSSVGAARADSKEALRRAFTAARAYGDVLIEQYLSPVEELEIAYFGTNPPLYSEIARVVSADGFYDFHEKYEGHTARITVPAPLPSDCERTLYRYARLLTEAVGARDLCRIDFFRTPDGALYFNEINTLPGFTASSLYPQLLARMGIPFQNLVARLVRTAYARGV